MAEFLSSHDKFVMQCPVFTLFAPQLARVPDSLIVFMQRDRAEIIASEDRLEGWTRNFAHLELATYGLTEGCPSDVKKRAWEVHKTLFQNWIEIDGNEATTPLRDHPLWLDDRTGFRGKQTEPE